MLDFKKELKERETAPRLQKTFSKVLDAWRMNRRIYLRDLIKNTAIQDAVREQNKIGWDNFILGRWSLKWQRIQKNYYASINSKRSVKRWAAAIIHKLIMIVWDLWSFRNKLVHGPKGIEESERHKELNSKIEEEYSKGSLTLIEKDKHLIDDNGLEDLTTGTVYDKQAWLERIEAARIAAEMEEETKVNEQRLITEFFGRL